MEKIKSITSIVAHVVLLLVVLITLVRIVELLPKSSSADEELIGFDKCLIPKIGHVPNNSTVVVGHAYGAHSTASHDGWIANPLVEFLNKNSNSINSLILTGDVFYTPSIEKWNRLYNEYSNFFDIHVAPGNHDIERPDSRDTLMVSAFGSQTYPYTHPDLPLIIENSMDTQWFLDPKSIDLVGLTASSIVWIARHNPPLRELRQVANATIGMNSELDTFTALDMKLSDDTKEIVWLIGDAGAEAATERLSCYEKNNHKFVFSGIGEVPGDQILLIHNSKLYSYLL